MDNNRLNKKTLARAIARRSGLQLNETLRCLDGLIEVFAETLEGGGEIRLQGLGTFQVHEMGERFAYNPGLGTHVVIPVRKRVKFIPSAIIDIEGKKE